MNRHNFLQSSTFVHGLLSQLCWNAQTVYQRWTIQYSQLLFGNAKLRLVMTIFHGPAILITPSSFTITVLIFQKGICLYHSTRSHKHKLTNPQAPTRGLSWPHTLFCIRHFHISHNAPYLSPQMLHKPLFFVSPGYYSLPKRNWKQCLCKIFVGNKVHCEKCRTSECNCSLEPRSRFIASSGMRD